MHQERFSVELKNVIDFVINTLLKEYPTYKVTQYHLLYRLLEDEKTIFAKIMSEIVTDFTLEKLHNDCLVHIEKVSLAILNPKKKIIYEKEFEEILSLSDIERKEMNMKEVDTFHILLSILKKDYGISQMLKNAGVNIENVKTKKQFIDEISQTPNLSPTTPNKTNKQELVVLSNGMIAPVIRQPVKNKIQNIQQYTTNLNILFQQGKMDRVIGRISEVEEIIKTVLKRKKNNAIITGEGGCGLTSIVNFLVEKICLGSVPIQLINKEILQINVQSIIIGMAYKGIFEQRTSDLIKEIKSTPNKYILFIDDINAVIQSDTNNEIVSFINTILQDDDLRIIATCPNQSYKSTIGKNGYMEKRFNRINVDKLNIEDTTKILIQNKCYYENYHNVYFNTHIIEKCVKLCDRYITSKVLPSSAIEVIDILGSSTHIDKNDKKLEDLIIEINTLIQQQNDSRKMEKHKEVDEYTVRINKIQQEIKSIQKKYPQEVVEITEDDLLKTVSELSKIPIQNISIDELNTIKDLPNELKKEIINQDEAVESICKSIQKRKINIRNIKKPSVFLFVGGTGVGKTYLSELIAKHVFGSEKNVIKLNGSEYSEEHSVSKILGAPAGYIGYSNNSSLSEIKTKPFSILLLDEFEKMSDKVINIFLQVFDKGELRESDGTILDFSNTIIILTSNLGSRNADSYNKLGFSTQTNIEKDKRDIIVKEIKKKLSPEIRNRIDEIIHFNHLQESDLKNIINLQLTQLSNEMKNGKYSCNLLWQDEVVDFLYNELSDDDKKLGARSINRVISSNVENNITDFILTEQEIEGDLRISINNGIIEIRKF